MKPDSTHSHKKAPDITNISNQARGMKSFMSIKHQPFLLQGKVMEDFYAALHS